MLICHMKYDINSHFQELPGANLLKSMKSGFEICCKGMKSVTGSEDDKAVLGLYIYLYIM